MIKCFLTVTRFPYFHPSLTNVPEVFSSIWTIISLCWELHC